MSMEWIKESDFERLKRNCEILPNGCWSWKRFISKDGYVRVIVGSRTNKTRKVVTAHRAMYQIVFGEIPLGKLVCHKCDNPSCVNPEHLFLGSYKDNMDDMRRKNRQPVLAGESNPRAKLNFDDVLKIKEIYKRGGISFVKLGKLFGVKATAIYRIVNGIGWKHAPNRQTTEQVK